MSNAWFHYLGPLGVAIVFVIVGVTMLLSFWRGIRGARDSKFGLGCGGIIAIAVGGTLGLVILLAAPPPWQRQRIFEQVYHTPPENIQRFVILPGRANQYLPLTYSQVVIDDPARIRRIAEILRTGTEVLPNHPRARRTADVEMVTRDGTYYFNVEATEPGDANGTLVNPSKSLPSGWNLGDVRANGLDKILEEAVTAANKRHGLVGHK